MNTYILKNVNLLDGTLNMNLQEGVSILVVDGKIKKIDKVIEEDGIKVIDLKGKFLTPGLINLHLHLPASGKPKKKKLGDMTKLVDFICKNNFTRKIGIALEQKYAQIELMSGVTTIRTVGGISNFDTILRDKINSGKVLGPRIKAANYAIGVPDGHMVGTVAKCANNIPEALEFIEDLKKDKVDLIKLMITGGVLDGDTPGTPGLLKMQPDMVKAICDKAHEYGFYCAAHVESAEGIKVAIENGVDSIEHGAIADDETLELLKSHNGVLVSTLSPALPFVLIDPKDTAYGEVAKINSDIVFNGIVESTKKCLEKGITVGLGTDAGSSYITHYDFWRELGYFVKYTGVTPNFALHTGTCINAMIAGCGDVTGTIEVGKSADFVVTDNNPLDDFANYKNPYMVGMKGKIIKQPKIKKFKDVDAILDSWK